MKTKDKNTVVALLAAKYDSAKSRYQALVKCFLKLAGATPGQKRYYNASKFTKGNLQALEYDMKKLCGISEADVKKASKAIKKATVADNTPSLPNEVLDKLNTIELESADYNKELKPLAKLLAEHTSKEPQDQKKVTLLAFIESFIPKGPSIDELKTEFSEALKSAPEDVKKGLKIRELYPFLNDDDCPDEFHTLTGKMVSAFINWKEGRKELKALIDQGVSNEELRDISKKIVENFELNLDCHDELTYYQENGKILGKHPIFADKVLQEEVETMGEKALNTRKKNLASYISRDTKAYDKMEEGEAKNNFGEKIKAWERERELIDARLKRIAETK